MSNDEKTRVQIWVTPNAKKALRLLAAIVNKGQMDVASDLILAELKKQQVDIERMFPELGE